MVATDGGGGAAAAAGTARCDARAPAMMKPMPEMNSAALTMKSQ
jgi:hypothetical protein